MKYMMLIHQGSTPTPRSPDEWESLPEDEQKAIYGAYKAINETPGSAPASSCGPPRRQPLCRCRTARR